MSGMPWFLERAEPLLPRNPGESLELYYRRLQKAGYRPAGVYHGQVVVVKPNAQPPEPLPRVLLFRRSTQK